MTYPEAEAINHAFGAYYDYNFGFISFCGTVGCKIPEVFLPYPKIKIVEALELMRSELEHTAPGGELHKAIKMALAMFVTDFSDDPDAVLQLGRVISLLSKERMISLVGELNTAQEDQLVHLLGELKTETQAPA